MAVNTKCSILSVGVADMFFGCVTESPSIDSRSPDLAAAVTAIGRFEIPKSTPNAPFISPADPDNMTLRL